MNTNISTRVGRVIEAALFPLTPLQAKFDPPSPVHGWILDRALQTLAEDGLGEAALFFSSFQTDLYEGLYWADKGWKNFAHYCQQEHKYWPGASSMAEGYYLKALRSFSEDVHKSFFYLGAALHILQDMAVPHHAAGVLRDGHQEFERWVLLHWHELPSAQHGCYRSDRGLPDWIRHTVALAKPCFLQVSLVQGATFASFAEAAYLLVPLSVRTSTGFLAMAHSSLKSSLSKSSEWLSTSKYETA